MKRYLQLIGASSLLFALPLLATAEYSLPSDRSVVWQGNVGVKNDIPNRTSICATLSSTGGDNANAIQSAVDSCGQNQVVKLNAGTFAVGNRIKIKSGVTLRGEGIGKTIIKGNSGMSGAYVVGMNNGFRMGTTSIDLSSGFTKGSTLITTQVPHGWNVGDLVLIDQVNNPEGSPAVSSTGNNGYCAWCGRNGANRSLGQIVKITAVPSANTINTEIPLYWNFSGSLSPQATRIEGVTSNAGIEKLTVDNTESGSANQADNGATIAMLGVDSCWLNEVEAIGSYQNLVQLLAAYRNTIRGGKFHGGIEKFLPAYSPGRAYGLRFTAYASANLIENNEIYRLSPGIIMNGATSGNVVAYNYVHDLRLDQKNWEGSAIQFHGAHPVMNLIEGNVVSGRMNADNTWGSSSHNTFFRNKTNLYSKLDDVTVNRALWDFDIQFNSRFYNVIGNVSGAEGFESAYQYENVNFQENTPSIYRLGYNGDGDDEASSNDSQVLTTMLHHGNWDSVHGSVAWDQGISDHVLPKSLYLSTKPSWWFDGSWPAVGPDLTPMANSIPAQGPIQDSCLSFTYTDWGSCENGIQTRTVVSRSPSGCAGGSPILSQNCEQRYGVADFAKIVANWLKEGSALGGDVNGDGKVDVRDVGVVMSKWSN